MEICGEKSSMSLISCGVPQGSVLGHILFNLYINDIKNLNLNGRLIMFADDIYLFYPYKHLEVLKVQIEYDALIISKFARLHKLVLNAKKTKLICFRPHVMSRFDQSFSIYICRR